MIYPNSTALPREEIQAVIVQGRGINAQNICEEVLPLFGVNKRNGHLVQLGIANAELLRISDRIVTPGSNIDRTTFSLDGTTYTLAIRKEEVVIPDETELDFADYFSTEAMAAQTGNDKLMLTREYLCANAIFNTTTFGAAANSSVAYTAANLATISFIADVYTAIEKVRGQGEQPNTLIIPVQVYQRLRQATIVLNFVRGQLNAAYEINVNTIQKAFEDEGITKVLIGRSRYNNAVHGATPSLSLIWSNSSSWVGRTGDSFASQDGGINTVQGVGATLYWEPYGGPFIVETYRAEERESNIVRIKTSAVPFVANANAGTLIGTQYS
jgi:hypothetical protein